MISLTISDNDGISLAHAIAHARNMLNDCSTAEIANLTISLENYTKGFTVWLRKDESGNIKESYTITLMPTEAKQ